jgi:hypothetical protein
MRVIRYCLRVTAGHRGSRAARVGAENVHVVFITKCRHLEPLEPSYYRHQGNRTHRNRASSCITQFEYAQMLREDAQYVRRITAWVTRRHPLSRSVRGSP